MVEGLFKDKSNMERRVWTVENQILRLREENTTMSGNIVKLEERDAIKENTIEGMKKQIEILKERNEQNKKRRKEAEGSLNSVKEQLSAWFESQK